MAQLKAFTALRPTEKWVREVASLPYDVMTNEEALEMVKDHPYSFLNIDKPDIHTTEKGQAIYKEAGKRLQQMIDQGIFIEESEGLYIYELQTNQVHQYGLVGLVSVADYESGVIKKHENTRSDKQQERVWHIEHCKAHTGPIFLVDHVLKDLGHQLESYANTHKPLFDETFEDEITHRIYKVTEEAFINQWIEDFETIPHLYIADGHHRAAAACEVAEQLGESMPEAQNFLAVIFPKEQLQILAYHRVLKDESGYTKEVLWEKLGTYFNITPIEDLVYVPTQRHTFGMRYKKQWYQLTCKESYLKTLQGSDALDVSILQNEVLAPIFNIENPKEDPRIDFIPGVEVAITLNERTEKDMDIAFSLYPTSLDELIAVADENGLMPPKSTWFEPKLRSGFLIHPFTK
ncbi:MAG: DUF1015 domain-containing protein [Cellulosilyticum sp.]|nr:DUF1015 domain-containing protein [Cellulosilyticum sp.]